MLLSIGMIVKNEEKNLYKCLSAIKPILDNVYSELIIADTGSEDNTIEIAREFTDKVYQIEWRNDFAWARNTTIERAQGKWYMFLDADEFFENVTEIINFFNSGEYEQYGSARHRMRIITDATGYDTFFTPLRLAKLNKRLKFIGKIHEQFNDYKTPTKQLESTSVHVGYLYTGENAEKRKKEKHERNIRPLLEAYEKDPTDIHTIIHIVRDYHFAENLPKLKKFIDIGFALFEKDSIHPCYHFLKLEEILYYENSNDHEKTIDLVREYFKNTKILYTISADMRIYEAQSLEKLDRRQEAAEAYVQAYKLIEKYERGELNDGDLQINTSYGVSPETKKYVIRRIGENYASIGDFDGAIKWVDKYGIKMTDLFANFMTHIIKADKLEEIVKLYNYLSMRYDKTSKEYADGLAVMERHLANSKLKYKAVDALLDDENIKVDGSDYIKLQLLRKAYIDNEGIDKNFEYFINSKKGFSQIYSDVVAAGIKYGVSIAAFIDFMEITGTNALIESIIRTNEDLGQFITDYNLLDEANSVKSARILYLTADAALKYSKFTDEDAKIKHFETLIRIGYKYLSMIYRPEVFSDEIVDELFERDRFVYYAYKAYACKDKGDNLGFVTNLRAAVKRDDSMKDIILPIIERLQKEENEAQLKESYARVQLKRETAALKNAIKTLISSEDFARARQILESYAQINPSDPDIENLKNMLK